LTSENRPKYYWDNEASLNIIIAVSQKREENKRKKQCRKNREGNGSCKLEMTSFLGRCHLPQKDVISPKKMSSLGL